MTFPDKSILAAPADAAAAHVPVFLIVVVLLQEGAQQGLGAIEGGADTFFGKGKASASDRIFARLTSIVGVIFVVAAIVLNVVH